MNELYLRVRAFSYLLPVMDTKRTFQVQNKKYWNRNATNVIFCFSIYYSFKILSLQIVQRMLGQSFLRIFQQEVLLHQSECTLCYQAVYLSSYEDLQYTFGSID